MSEQSREVEFTWLGQRSTDPAHQQLAAFLLMDIQYSPENAEHLLSQINDVVSGHKSVWECVGNAYYLKIEPTVITIEDCVDESCPTRKVSLDEFRDAATAWLDYIQKRKSI